MTKSSKQQIICVVGCTLALMSRSAVGQSTQPSPDVVQIYSHAEQLIAANDARNISSPAASALEYRDYPPFPAEWERMEKEDFAANRAARDLAHQARSIDHAHWPAFNRSPSNYLNQSRNLANELGDAALWQHLHGNDAAAIETIRDLLHFSDLLEQSDSKRTLVNALVSEGIRALAMDRLDIIIAGAKLTNDPNDHQALQAITVRELIDYQLKKRDAQAEVDAIDPSENVQTNPEAHLDRILITFGRVNAECAMAAVSMACHLSRLDDGDWPKSMDDLQKYLPQPPIDPFGDGKQTIGYVLIKGGLPDGADRPLVFSREEMNGGLFFRTDQPAYCFYSDGDPNAPPAKQMRGGQFRDVTAWVPKAGAAPATQAVEDDKVNG